MIVSNSAMDNLGRNECSPFYRLDARRRKRGPVTVLWGKKSGSVRRACVRFGLARLTALSRGVLGIFSSGLAALEKMVELSGIEPLASSLRTRRSPN